MKIPKNCKECAHENYCHGPHYGGSKCEYKEEINKKIVEETLSYNKKD
jgi:hypothetical protein